MIKNIKTYFWWPTLVILAIVLGFFLKPFFVGEKIISPIAINFGFAEIYWYGILMFVGVLAAVRLFFVLSKGTFLNSKVIDLISWVVLGGILGARALFVILKSSEFEGSLDSIFYISNGGLSIHGALLGGLIAIIIYTRLHKIDIWSVLDLIVMPVILGQIIGRFGNFVNQEAFGPPTDLPWKMWVAVNNRPTRFEDFAYFHPTFLYEVIGLIILFVILRLFRDRLKLSGSRFWIYIIGYSILRYFVEYFRVDSDFWGSLTVAQWGSLVLIVIGVILFNLRLKSKLKP